MFNEGSSIDSKAVIEEVLVPSDTSLISHVDDMVLRLAVTRSILIEVGCSMIGGLSMVVTDITHNPCSDLEVPREGNLGITGNDVPEISAVGVVYLSIGERVVVVVGIEVCLGLDVPCPHTAVRTLPIQIVLEIHIHLTPLDEVCEGTAHRAVTVTGGVVVLPVGELIIKGQVEP